jgi:hypothetical protein
MAFCSALLHPNPNPNPNFLRRSFRRFRRRCPSPPLRPYSSSPPSPSIVACQQQGQALWTSTVQSGTDQLEICRVVNGMWQTSGGWGKIDPQRAVDSMLRYVDEGFFTFDMADHCNSSLSLSLCP